MRLLGLIFILLLNLGAFVLSIHQDTVFESLIPNPSSASGTCKETNNHCNDLKIKQILLEDKLGISHSELNEDALKKEPGSENDIDFKESTDEEYKSRNKRKTISSKTKFWPNNLVQYAFDKKGITPKHIVDIKTAIQLWENSTCLKFSPRKDKTSHYLLFRVWDQLHSETALGYSRNFAGYKGYQDIKLPKDPDRLSPGLIAHELGHTVGFVHEHTRKDRDNYVTINTNNIINGNAREFLIVNDFGGTTSFGLPYDYGSIMHYPQNRLAKDASIPTIEPVDPVYMATLGSSSVPTFLDYLEANTAFGCLCPENPSIQCLHNGYLDINDCSKCTCPDGFGGLLCETVANYGKGGSILDAKSDWTDIKEQIMKSVDDDNTKKFVWLIRQKLKAPPNRVVELKLDYIRRGLIEGVLPFCNLDYLEIKTATNGWSSTGYRFCSSKQRGVYRSAGNEMIVIANVELYALEIVLQYRQVDAKTPIAKLADAETCPLSKVTVSADIEKLMNDVWYGPQIQSFIRNYQRKCGGPFAEIIMEGNQYRLSIKMKGCLCSPSI